MKGIHSIYTFTDRVRYKEQSYLDMGLFEAYTLILSCCYWRKFHGDISLYCDKDFYKFIQEYKLTSLWDNIDNTSFDSIPNDINYSVFWTYPKMYIHSLQTQPFTSLDADLFFWEPLNLKKANIIYAHPEVDLTGENYPDYHTSKEYKDIFKDLTFNEYPSNMNTAILTINKVDFYKELMDITTRFAKRATINIKNQKSVHEWTHTIFCEQKIIRNVIEKHNLSCVPHYEKEYYTGEGTIWPEGHRFELDDAKIFHLWGSKTRIKNDQEERYELNKRLHDWIETDFPEMMDIVTIFKKILKP